MIFIHIYNYIICSILYRYLIYLSNISLRAFPKSPPSFRERCLWWTPCNIVYVNCQLAITMLIIASTIISIYIKFWIAQAAKHCNFITHFNVVFFLFIKVKSNHDNNCKKGWFNLKCYCSEGNKQLKIQKSYLIHTLH